ncbi:hypothetical protein OAU50_02260 [Planctomycetota bacterium]|nr:hypothetical protein [Planctomycetota bacterium]
MSQTLIAQIGTTSGSWYGAGFSVLGASLLILCIYWQRARMQRRLAAQQAEESSVAIEPVEDSDYEITAAEKKLITRSISSGSFRRFRDSVK